MDAMQQNVESLAHAIADIAIDVADPIDDGPSSSAAALITSILNPVGVAASRIAHDLAALGYQHRAAQRRVLRRVLRHDSGSANDKAIQAAALNERDRVEERIKKAAAGAAQGWRTAITIAVLTEQRTPQEQSDLDYLIANPQWLSDDDG